MDRLSRKDMLLNLLEKEQNDVFLNYALALELESLGDLNEAEHQLEKVLKMDPEYLACYYRLGQVNEKLKRTEEAITFYKQGLELAKKQGNAKTAGEINVALMLLED
jgi:tetratricopeptide (TPR) repeat protein